MNESSLRTEDFNYPLPPDLIAQTPIEPRDASRLLVVDRASGTLAHGRFHCLPDYLRAGDLLVLNDSRVLPARLRGLRENGGRCELLLLHAVAADTWLCLGRPARRLRVGDQLTFHQGQLRASVTEERPEGARVVCFAATSLPFAEMLELAGEMPLPPYIHVRLADPERYQTVYAREAGSAAAPTAGLHFTPHLLARLREGGVGTGFVTLHVGLGTFRPVQAEDVAKHQMHAEYGVLSQGVAEQIQSVRQAGGRIVAVGTTAVRVLESAALAMGPGEPWTGWTSIFIYPGFSFQAVDALITNFHLPRSTLLMLVSAFAGKTLVDRAYATAVAEHYRFFSFGDAMLLM